MYYNVNARVRLKICFGFYFILYILGFHYGSYPQGHEEEAGYSGCCPEAWPQHGIGKLPWYEYHVELFLFEICTFQKSPDYV